VVPEAELDQPSEGPEPIAKDEQMVPPAEVEASSNGAQALSQASDMVQEPNEASLTDQLRANGTESIRWNLTNTPARLNLRPNRNFELAPVTEQQFNTSKALPSNL